MCHAFKPRSAHILLTYSVAFGIVCGLYIGDHKTYNNTGFLAVVIPSNSNTKAYQTFPIKCKQYVGNTTFSTSPAFEWICSDDDSYGQVTNLLDISLVQVLTYTMYDR
jgi:hypothetical protein